MNAELLRQPSVQSELDATAETLLRKHNIMDVDLSAVTAIEYVNHQPNSEPSDDDLDVILYPDQQSARVGFRYRGEMHGMYFRFKREKLENAARDTNGYQPCPPEREDFLRQVLDEMRSNDSVDSRLDFRFHTQEPVKLRF